MKNDESLYIRTLRWAAEKGSDGFTTLELKAAIAKTTQEGVWIDHVFVQNSGLLTYRPSATGNYTYFLTGEGLGALYDYEELKEAREGSKAALFMAYLALWVAIGVGLCQIGLQVYQLFFYRTPLAEIQSDREVHVDDRRDDQSNHDAQKDAHEPQEVAQPS